MTRVRGRKKIIWVPFGTQQVSCDWQSPSQNYSSRSNPSSRVSFAAQAVLMTCLTAACWSLESALTRRAVNREMRESIEIKPSLFWQPRWKGAQRLCRGGEESLGGGGFNCMWGPSQRWQGLINKHRGLQKQTNTLSCETMRHEGRAIGMPSWPGTPHIMLPLYLLWVNSVSNSGGGRHIGKTEWCHVFRLLYLQEYYSFSPAPKAKEYMYHGAFSRLPR